MSIEERNEKDGWYVIPLGVAQDGGYPQCGCQSRCCLDVKAADSRSASCLALVHVKASERTIPTWLFDVTPDFKLQHAHLLGLLKKQRLALVQGKEQEKEEEEEVLFSSPYFRPDQAISLRGVFLTHAHIGHYTGLAMFGKEALNARHLPVYCGAKMARFLRENGPWNQLVELNQIDLRVMAADEAVVLGDAEEAITVRAFEAPHRAEYSETLGFIIADHALYLPDVDHWRDWPIFDHLQLCQLAFLDATFYDPNELPGRDLSAIPHPFVVDSMKHLAAYASKIHFIHFNHSNPLLWDPATREKVQAAGFHIAQELQFYSIPHKKK